MGSCTACIANVRTKEYNINKKLGAIIMAKTSNIYVRLEPGLKEQAELVLEQLGIPVSSAVNIFLKQVVMQRGLPFEVKLTAEHPVEMGKLTEAQMNTELEKGYTDFIEGKTKSAEQVFANIRKDYNL